MRVFHFSLVPVRGSIAAAFVMLLVAGACSAESGAPESLGSVAQRLQEPVDLEQYSWDPGIGIGGSPSFPEPEDPPLGEGDGDKCFDCSFDEDCNGTRDAALMARHDECILQCGADVTQPEDVGTVDGEACFRFRCCGGGANTEGGACEESYWLWFYGQIGPECGPNADEPDPEAPQDCGEPMPEGSGSN